MSSPKFVHGPMTPFEMRLAADLLKMAAEEFGRHCCNDLPLPNTEDANRLGRQYHEWNGDPQEWEDYPADRPIIYFNDSAAMAFLADRLRHEAETA